MSKRYVIQINVATFAGADPLWENVQHPAGGDWLTRRRSTAIADAAKLVNAGETRELRIAISLPVYDVKPEVGMDAIREAAAAINVADAADYVNDDFEDEGFGEGSEEGDENEDVAPASFELVDESNAGDGNAHNN